MVGPSIASAFYFMFVKIFPMKKYVLPIVGILFVFMVIFFIARYSYTYSEGNRAGRLIKFSKQGIMFKTYEGEMNLGGVTNAANNSMMMNYMWDFSVTDQSVADSLLKLEGKEISVHYKEKMAKLPWRGDTKYMVDKIVEVRDNKGY
jgi:hypothetical protein